MRSQLLKAADYTLLRFEQIHVPWCPRGILRSEAFAFCLMCDHYAVDGIVESGVCNGRSTEFFASYHPGTRVTALDWAITEEARKVAARHANIRLQGTDSTVTIIPYVATAGSRVGVFIDGPKGESAVRLAVECMKLDNVSFVGVHDVAGNSEARPLFDQSALDEDRWTWVTDEDWFVARFAFLDVTDARGHADNESQWFPYSAMGDDGKVVMLGSYGYTIGFLYK